MWLRICRLPDRTIDGVTPADVQIGGIIELGSQVASVFLAEGWGRPVFVRMERHIGASTPQRLLLVVDDDAATRSLLTELFNANGYAVVLAENGEEGLKQLLDYAPDLVVLDLQMPVMDGWRFREQQLLSNVRVATVPVVLLTGTNNAAKSAKALHAAGFIEKPFEPDLLLGTVLKALKTKTGRATLDRRLRS